MTKPTLTKLCSLALAVAGALTASTAMAQAYRVLPVQGETTADELTGDVLMACYVINYHGTVACNERIFSSWVPQNRLVFDNPLNRPSSGRLLPSVALPGHDGHRVTLNGFNTSGIVAGKIDWYNGTMLNRIPIVAANGATISIQNPFNSGVPVEVTGINEQGWLLLSRTITDLPTPEINAYLRVPGPAGFAQYTNLPISCSPHPTTGRIPPAYPSKVNSNGLIGGYCGTKPVVWGWWDLTTSVDLEAALPAMIDLGSGLVPRPMALDGLYTNSMCKVVDMADRADVVLIECSMMAPNGLDWVVTNFVNTPASASEPSAFRQLPLAISASSPIKWRAVNEDGCAVGTALQGERGVAVHGVLKCPTSNQLTFLTFANEEGYMVRDAVDINGRGDILAYASRSGTNGYVVLTSRR